MELNGFDIFLILFVSGYTLILAVFSIGFLFYRPAGFGRQKDFVSVLVAARDEEEHIGACIQHLLRQTYPRDRFEIIIIDDRSTDKTSSLVKSYQEKYNAIRLITVTELSPHMAPKKHALNEGIKAAKGDIIVCTDADCRPEENWLTAMVSTFDPGVGMVVGYSPIEPKRTYSIFENFIALDSLALASVAAASSAFGKTITATGRSLAYRKKAFDEVGGFSRIAHVVSGDDDLLLGLVRQTHWDIRYCLGEKTLAGTDPPPSFGKFVNQKIRQASKGRYYGYKMIAGLTLFYVFNLMMITYVPMKMLVSDTLTHVLFYAMVWAIKLSGDFLLLTVGAFRFGRWRYLMFYPVVALLHPLYISVFGAWGFFGKFQWKDTVQNRLIKSGIS
ncbi:glycosyltransferase [bacterium]|nr:glycosyltransferase [bacterium]